MRNAGKDTVVKEDIQLNCFSSSKSVEDFFFFFGFASGLCAHI